MVAAMTYTPKPGDRVVSPLLVADRTWTVESKAEQINMLWWWCVDQHGNRIPEAEGRLTPVAPPPPPEPPVGSVVRARGKLWMRRLVNSESWWWCALTDQWKRWADLATADDLSPVVAVDDAAEWINQKCDLGYDGDAFRAEFGGWGKPKPEWDLRAGQISKMTDPYKGSIERLPKACMIPDCGCAGYAHD